MEEKVIREIKEMCINISEVNKKYKYFSYAQKENFNLFSAIVNHNDKNYEHIEKYHSNIISYLLNPSESHDCGDLFLNLFIDEIFKKEGKPNWLILKEVKVAREFNANGRFIDIVIYSKKNWIIYIENKINSGEGNNQLQDYSEYAKNNFENSLGIYLTKSGNKANINSDYFKENYLFKNLSYNIIINWLEKCCTYESFIYTPHIPSSLIQYIKSLKKLLNIMSNYSEDEILNYVRKIDNLDVIYENIDYVKKSIESLILEKRIALFEEFINNEKFKDFTLEKISDKEVNFIINADIYLTIAFSFPETDEEKGRGFWYGLYGNQGKNYQIINSNNSCWESIGFEIEDNRIISDYINDTDEVNALLLRTDDCSMLSTKMCFLEGENVIEITELLERIAN